MTLPGEMSDFTQPGAYSIRRQKAWFGLPHAVFSKQRRWQMLSNRLTITHQTSWTCGWSIDGGGGDEDESSDADRPENREDAVFASWRDFYFFFPYNLD